ncbi:hypothetical protein LZ30DRAFT_398598 [Colletotrichum cereale]|nr:hypothetical protein LZ30DRAFT_398598 [Colletotrichum cereale]
MDSRRSARWTDPAAGPSSPRPARGFLTKSYGDRTRSVAVLCRPTDHRFPARGKQAHPPALTVCRWRGAVRRVPRVRPHGRRRPGPSRPPRLPQHSGFARSPVQGHRYHGRRAGVWDRRHQELEWRGTPSRSSSPWGLSRPTLSATCKQVEQRKVDFVSSPDHKMYSRYDGTVGGQ